jgi:hypothetical protein
LTPIPNFSSGPLTVALEPGSAAHLTTPESLKIGECLQQTYRQRSLPLESLSNLLQRRKANDLDYDEPHD